MKAVVQDVAGGPGVLRFEEVADPVCGPDDVVIDVRAVSIEGGDLLNRASAPVPASSHVPGYAAAGIVVHVGSKVHDIQTGTAVTTFGMSGSHAALRSVPRAQAWEIPVGVSFAQAAAVPITIGTADHSLFAAGHLQAGETVLVQAGAGGVGLAAVQLAHGAGATVIATVSGKDRAQRLRDIGVDCTIDHRADDMVDAVRSFMQGAGVDLVIDPVGTTITDSLRVLTSHGRLVFVGNAGGRDLQADLSIALEKNLLLRGVFMGTEYSSAKVRSRLGTLLHEVQQGALTVFIDREFPLSEAAQAHAYAEKNSVFGRVILSNEP